MRLSPSLLALLAVTPALAEPKVLVDLPPVHSLVAQVMDGVGTPTLLLDRATSGHDLSLRPSQAGAAQEADLIFWVGPAMSPGLEKPFETLGENARIIALMEQPETLIIDSANAEAHLHNGEEEHEAHDDHDHEDHAEHDHEAHDDHDHEAHDDHNHEDHAEHDHEAHDDHDHENHAEHNHEAHDDHEDHAEGAHDGHDHGPEDPHVWLDPVNAQAWLPLIAKALSEKDPENAEAYSANATRAAEQLAAQTTEIAATLAPYEGREYLATHRAFAYFESRFHLAPAHALSGVDGNAAGPRAMEEVRLAAEEGITCLITEPDTSSATVATLTEGTALTAHGLDPLGRDIAPGPDHYSTLLQEIAATYAACLK
ncbi:zinc transporter [Oceanicola sp. D3]|uniref:zinc ABC transporter substrate-binding protein n=1 Tax=Oceanicola sp. D3 TaxID=2587163 RepID=UPI0011221FD6|nr:zinc ABC transporter substrate-binding protein [Oceanicola sp. D3]QDC09970.1 zinc transporter [Oceanicola sp. D3]